MSGASSTIKIVEQQHLPWTYHTPPLKMTQVALRLSLAALACIGIISFLLNPFDNSVWATSALYCTYGSLGGIVLLLAGRVVAHCREQILQTTLREQIINAPIQKDEVNRLKELTKEFVENTLPHKKSDHDPHPKDAQLLETLHNCIDQKEFQEAPLSYMGRLCSIECRSPKQKQKNSEEAAYIFLRDAVKKIREQALTKAIQQHFNAY